MINCEKSLKNFKKKIKRYKRIRLYETSRQKKRLMGRVEVGGGLRVEFNHFSFFLHEEPTSYQTCITERKPKIFDSRDYQTPFFKQLGREEVTAWIEYPLIYEDRELVGCIYVDNKGDVKTKFTEEDFDILRPFFKN